LNIEKAKGVSGLSEPFGYRRPPRIYERIISFLHSKNTTFLQRLLAPVARKIIINSSDLPIDVRAGNFNLRCQFTDNYSEKKYVFTPWRYDFGERLELINALPKDGVFIDIGANIGLYTLVAAEVMGDNGRILAFEPSSLTLQRLSINLEANHKDNGRPNIQVLNVGVADENGERVLQIDEKNLGASSIAKPGQSGVEEKIHCRLLLDVLQELNITRIDALKIDIEGAEDIALVPFIKKADDSLLPGLILIENSDDKWSHDLFGLLSEKGYRRVLKTRLNSVLKRKL
jgi:FkbM family methyltransferase